MCKPVLLIILAISFTSIMAQQTTPAPVLSGEDYLKKGKGQRTAAWVLAGAGTTCIATGFAIGFGQVLNALATLFTTESSNYNNTGEVLLFSGLVMLGGSIPLFIISGKNMRKAREAGVSFKLDDRWQLNGIAMTRKFYPALQFRIPINKK